MVKKLTNEDIIERMYSLVGDEYTKLDDVYVNNQTKFSILHNTCGHEYEVRWNDFKGGSRCPKCSLKQQVLKRTLSNGNIIERMYELVGDEYSKLDDVYLGNRTKFPIRHNTCGHEYEVHWNNFQSGVRCPKCSGLMKFTNENIVERMYDLAGDEYTKLDDVYINANTKFSIKHNICGHEYEVSWGKFQSGNRCPKCSGHYKYTDSEIIEMISDMTQGEYTKLSIYINAQTKFPIRHNVCGHEYEVRWNDFRRDNRCPKCNQSKGEKFISDYLTNKNISFTTQARFDDCRQKRPLPFDFGIVDDENMIIALIEFDGKQHFESVELWGGEEALALTQLRDQIKNQYCEDNNIPLLRIRYDEDIEEKLTTFLKET